MRAELAGLEERHRGERAAMARLEQQFREITARREAIAPEIERLGEQRSRLLADNIELDRRRRELAARDPRRWKRAWTRWRCGMRPCAKHCAPARKS